MSAERLDTATQTVEIKTRRGILRVGPYGRIQGLWELARKELRTQTQVCKMIGVTRQTLAQKQRRRHDPFPGPVLEFETLKLWDRSQVERWRERNRQTPQR